MANQTETNQFERVICEYLTQYARDDEQFAQKFDVERKSIKECCNYIINQVRKSGRIGFADAEIYSLAVHFYDETELRETSSRTQQCKVVINQEIQLSEEDKQRLRQSAEQKFEQEQLIALRKAANAKSDVASKTDDSKQSKQSKKRTAQTQQQAAQLSLFDL
jgi:hypothetical protein